MVINNRGRTISYQKIIVNYILDVLAYKRYLMYKTLDISQEKNECQNGHNYFKIIIKFSKSLLIKFQKLNSICQKILVGHMERIKI